MKYEVIREKYEGICGKYEGIRGKYEGICGKYEGGAGRHSKRGASWRSSNSFLIGLYKDLDELRAPIQRHET